MANGCVMTDEKGRKILILNYEFPPIGGGGGIVSQNLAQGWARLGYDVDIVTSSFKNLEKKTCAGNITIFRVKTIGRKEMFSANFISMLSYLFFGLIEIIKLRKSEYVFINTHFVLPTGPLGFFASKLFKTKNILSIHEGDVYDPTVSFSPHNKVFYRMIINFLFRNAYKIVAQSNDTKTSAENFYKLDKKIQVIPIAYEEKILEKKERSELNLKETSFYLIAIGRLIEKKGFQYILEALKNLPIGIELLLIGDGPLRVKLREAAQKYKVEDRVKFLGYVSEEKKFQYLYSADIFVLSSIREGFGIVLQEAMQAGLPIVSTDDGGQNDFLEKNINALLVRPGNSEQLVKKILELYGNKTLRERLGKNNLNKIKEFSIEKIAREYLNLLNL